MTQAKKSVKQAIEDASLKAVKSQVAKIVLEQIMKATPKNTPSKTKVAAPKASLQVQAAEKALARSPWGSSDPRTAFVAEVVSAILGQPVGVRSSCSSSVMSKAFMLVVPVKPTPGYATGKPTMFKSNGGSHGLTFDPSGKLYRESNQLPYTALGNSAVLRYATEAEAKAFVAKATSSMDNIQRLRDYLGGDLDSLLG